MVSAVRLLFADPRTDVIEADDGVWMVSGVDHVLENDGLDVLSTTEIRCDGRATVERCSGVNENEVLDVEAE